ncbi:hypothetical protein KUTeg_017272 [Tegillarca granosa]|uniref:Uncharacterized protein n=1 Tax=Tegillarca granosa TaxID=220873 RepID=A0ABQ9EMM4_TEGGR|nr:hypothetical protein KUTeg_017272 [Tegillarca granosa]
MNQGMMTKTDNNNSKSESFKMSKRKTNQSSEGRKVDAMNTDRENADRIAAAEAMSCLSSLVLLPSNSEEMIDFSQRENDKLISEALVKAQNANKTTNSTKSRRGKTKKHEGGTAIANQNTDSKATGNNAPSRSKGKSKTSTKQNNTETTQQMLTLSQNSTTHLQHNGTPIILSDIERVKNYLRDRKIAAEQQQIQQNNNSISSNSQVLKLPLLISNCSDIGSSDLKDVASPSSIESSDSVELTPSTVESLLNTKQIEAVESSLPLKKRKILGIKDKSDKLLTATDSSGINHNKNVIDLTMEGGKKEKENVQEQKPKVGSQAPLGIINVDPQTSLMLLTEVHLALQQDEDGDLPLHIAVVHENIVMTPLHLAVELKFVDAIQVLLLAGANPNLVNKRGENSIHLSVKYDIIEALEIMIKKSQYQLDLNTRNFDGLSPLHTAVCKGNIAMVELLLSAGAEINIPTKGASIDLPNYAGITAAMAAQARGFQETQAILLRGMDSKSYQEGKDRDKSITPNKKVPIPRIPSKSHLIVQEGQSKPSNQNSDSNDSWTNQSNSSLQNKVIEEPMEMVDSVVEIVESSSLIPVVNISNQRTSTPEHVEINEPAASVIRHIAPPTTRTNNPIMTSEGHVTSVNASTATLLAKRLLARQTSARPLDLSSKTEQISLDRKTEGSVR